MDLTKIWEAKIPFRDLHYLLAILWCTFHEAAILKHNTGHCRSDVGPDVGFEAVGLIDAKLETVGVWAKTKEDPPPAEVLSNNFLVQ